MTLPARSIAWPLLCGLLISLLGCDQAETPKQAAHESDPAELMREVVAAYRAAAGYSDQGKLRLSYKVNGEEVKQEWASSVAFVRPGRIRIESYSALVASDAEGDGKSFLARVTDPDTNDLDGQIVVRPAPEKFSLTELEADPLLADQLVSRLRRGPIPLELLLGDNPLAPLFAPETKWKRLSDVFQDFRAYRCVEALAPEGRFVFWIDATMPLLMRVELPATSIVPELMNDPAVSEVSLAADLERADLTPDVAKLSFTFDLPAGAKQVRSFVIPPQAVSHRSLGKTPEAFELAGEGEAKFTAADLPGKIRVWLWYSHHAACEAPVKRFNAVAKTLGEKEEFSFSAVCVEPPQTDDARVAEQWKAWQGIGSPLRDCTEAGDKTFQIRELPYYLVFDREGKLQVARASADDPGAWLPKTLDRIAAGEDLAAESLAREAELRKEYEKLIASGGAEPGRSQQPATPIEAASPPAKTTLKEMWRTEFSAPIIASLCGESDDVACRLLDETGVLHTVAQDGSIATSKLPKLTHPVSLLRSQITADGTRYYLAFSPQAVGVTVFDAAWKVVCTYPPPSDEVAFPVRDARLLDLEGDGTPELIVGFGETGGVHAVTLAGERKWTNRSYHPLISLAIAQKNEELGPRILLAGRGGVGALNRFGNADPEVGLSPWSVSYLAAAGEGTARKSPYAALAEDRDRRTFLVGLDEKFREQWNYPLPPLNFSRPIDFLAAGELRSGSGGEWLVAGADGSIHFVSHDGAFNDRFNYGEAIFGLGVGCDRTLLIVSSGAVAAFTIEAK